MRLERCRRLGCGRPALAMGFCCAECMVACDAELFRPPNWSAMYPPAERLPPGSVGDTAWLKDSLRAAGLE